MEEKKIIIYIADDDQRILEVSKERWEVRNVTAFCFATVADLLSALRETAELPTAVLMDFVMDGGGTILIQQLRKSFPELPVIVYSGLDTQGSIAAYNKGAYAVMQKPLDFNELHDTFKELAGQEDMFKRLAMDTLALTQFDTCLVWQFDKALKAYKIVGWTAGVDQKFVRKTSMSEQDFSRISRMKNGEVIFIDDVTSINAKQQYARPDEAKWRHWVSLLAVPMVRSGRLIGWIDCYKKDKPHTFKDEADYRQHIDILRLYANQAMQALHSSTLTQHQRIMHETNQNLAGTLHNKLIFDNILTKIIEVTGADCGWIYEYDNREKLLKLGKCYGFEQEYADKIRPLENGGITGEVARSGESLNVPDITQKSDGYSPEMYISIPPEMPIQSVLSVPLRRRERTLGVLTIKSIHRDFFTQDDSQLITSLASIAAICLDRAKLIRHLGVISSQAQEVSDFDLLAQYIVDAVHDLTEADVNLWMMSKREGEGDEWMRIKSSSRRDANMEYQTYIEEGKTPTTLGTSLIAKALYENTNIVIKDLFEHDGNPPFFNKEAIMKFNWRSFLVVPLIGKNGEHLGALSLSSTVRNNFNEDDGRLIRHFADQATLALQEQEHITVLQELTDVGRDLNIGLPGAKDLSQRVVEMARKISQADMTVLYPYDMENNAFYDRESCVFSGPLRSEGLILTEKPRTDGLAAFIRENTAIIVENANEDDLVIRVGFNKPQKIEPTDERYKLVEKFIKGAKFIKREKISSFLGISLRAADKVKSENIQEVAVLYINFRAHHHFNEQQLQVMDIFCNQVANIIHRNRLFVSLSNQSKVLEGIHNSALHILATPDNKNRLEKIVEEAVKLLKAKGGKVYLVVNGSRQDLRLVAHKGIAPARLKNFKEMPSSAGMAGEVLRTRQPLIVDDYANYPNRIKALSDLFSSVIEVPLMIRDEMIGVLGVFDNKKRRFTKGETETLMGLASQAALAIYNSQLYDELDAIYQTGIQITTQADVNDMASRVLKELKRVIQYDRATFQLIKSKEEPRVMLANEGYLNKMSPDTLLRPVKHDKLIAPILKKGKPYVLSNTRSNPNWDKNILETKNVKSWVCIPLMFKEVALGIIMLDNYKEGFYQQKDVPKLERFATIAATALHNASMGQLHLGELHQFADRILKLHKEDSKEDILQEAIRILQRVFQPLSLKYHYVEETYIEISRVKGLTNLGIIESAPLHFGQGLAGWVAQEGESKLYPDDFHSVLRLEDVLPAGTTLLFSPIWKMGEVVGVVEIEAKETDHDQSRKSFLSTLITQASLAIQQIEQRDRRLEAIKTEYNPYIVGNPIRKPEDFFGRKDILSEILSSLSNNNFAVIDERRIGKTSLLYRLDYELKYAFTHKKITFHPIYFSLQGIDAELFYALLIEKIREALQLSIMYIEAPKSYDYFVFRKDLDKVKKELLNQSKKPVVVLLIDEIDVFKIYPSKIQQQLRSTLVTEDMLRVVLVGFDIDFNPTSLTSPWFNFLNIRELGNLQEEDARNLIVNPVKDYYTYQEDSINLILKHSDMKPFVIQSLCTAALSAMFKRIKKTATPDLPIILEEDVVQAIRILNAANKKTTNQ